MSVNSIINFITLIAMISLGSMAFVLYINKVFKRDNKQEIDYGDVFDLDDDNETKDDCHEVSVRNVKCGDCEVREK